MCDEQDYLKSLEYWRMGSSYLNLTKNVFYETINSNNRRVTITDNTEETRYEEATAFSDFRIMIPTLFTFFHGIELLLKGFIRITSSLKKNHKIESLFIRFKEEFPSEIEIIEILERYLSEKKSVEPLNSFFNHNNVSANQFYDILKYPEDKDATKAYDYMDIRYRGKEILSFFQTTVNDIEHLQLACVALSREIEARMKNGL